MMNGFAVFYFQAFLWQFLAWLQKWIETNIFFCGTKKIVVKSPFFCGNKKFAILSHFFSFPFNSPKAAIFLHHPTQCKGMASAGQEGQQEGQQLAIFLHGINCVFSCTVICWQDGRAAGQQCKQDGSRAAGQQVEQHGK